MLHVCMNSLFILNQDYLEVWYKPSLIDDVGSNLI